MDPRKILGVDNDASLKDIQRAYRKKVSKHHPDLGGELWAFQQINEAYEVLVAHIKRTGTIADLPLQKMKNRQSTSGSQSTTPPRPQPSPPKSARAAPTPSADFSNSMQPESTTRPTKFGLGKFFTQQLPLQTETSFFILANVLDIFVTYVILRFDGVEANPIARFFIEGWGLGGMLGFKLAIVALVCLLAQAVAHYRLQSAKRLLWAGTTVVGCVVVYSLWLVANRL